MKDSIKKHIHNKIKLRITYDSADYSFQPASDMIRKFLLSHRPCMITRIGSSELECIAEYKKFKIRQSNQNTNTASNNSIFSAHSKYRLFTNSGFFPINDEMLSRFCQLVIDELKGIDILGTWLNKESYFKEELKDTIKIRLPDLEPYYHDDPWTTALTRKKVLVIHPFSKTIEKQYQKRKLLFSNDKVLPEFELKTIKAVQSLAGEKTPFNNWFEALEHMKNQVNKISFDIAIIGCGAYGLPLAAHVKQIGKKSVQLGGATQILFGITGRRWEEEKKFISTLINDHWVKPGEKEKPEHWKKVENGCYW